MFNVSILYRQIPGCVNFFDISGNLSIHLSETDSGGNMAHWGNTMQVEDSKPLPDDQRGNRK